MELSRRLAYHVKVAPAINCTNSCNNKAYFVDGGQLAMMLVIDDLGFPSY